MNDLVSVVVPTHKRKGVVFEEHPFDICLMSIALSSYRYIEVIGIDEGKERSVQRNIGIKTARGKYILYLDDDQYISSGLIEECIGLIKNGYDAIYIPETIVTNTWFGELRNWERQFYTGTAVDCVRFFKAEGCPLFDETMNGPEDADFDHRVGGLRAISVNELYHCDNVGVYKYFTKKAYYAKSMGLYQKKWPDDKVLNVWYRCFGVFIEKGKWKRLIQKPHYTLALLMMVLIRGVIYLWQIRKG